jgi:hypothetical protein
MHLLWMELDINRLRPLRKGLWQKQFSHKTINMVKCIYGFTVLWYIYSIKDLYG